MYQIQFLTAAPPQTPLAELTALSQLEFVSLNS